MKRGDREPGHGEFLLPLLYPQDGYDMVIDTANTTTDEAVDMILKSIDEDASDNAFVKWEKYYKLK